MHEKIIEFSAHEIIVADKSLHPEPAKFNLPEWFKSLKTGNDRKTRNIKNCKPFLDSLLAGYILKNPIDQEINFNTINPNNENKIDFWIEVNNSLIKFSNFKDELNFNLGNEYHPLHQIGGDTCPFAKANKNYNIYKLMNPWGITLPKGYSALYIPPLNRSENRFEILPGIVDYGYTPQVNFPCIIKKEGTWVLKKGEPIAAVFPFKMDSWKMKITTKTKEDFLKEKFNFYSILWKFYEKFNWNKKSWS